MAKKKKKSGLRALSIIVSFIIIIIGVLSYVYPDAVGYVKSRIEDILNSETEEKTDVLVSGDLEIHFLELGNKYTGDCTYIRNGDVDILIDAGSRASSIPTIREYLDARMSDGVLEYVIVTHAHEDHYAGFATSENVESLFDIYEVEVIIDFAQITKGKEDGAMYNNYVRERTAEIAAGATHYTAAKCRESGNYIFDLGDGIELEILDSLYYYERTSSENDHSVCTMINQGDRHFLFTGDLEERGEKKLVEMNDLPEVVLYKAGHHGSKTSSSEELLSVINPEIVCVCCCAGSTEYTDNSANTFPTQEFCDRVSPYTDKVYVTTVCVDYKNAIFESMNGDIVVRSGEDGVTVTGSANSTPLKDTEWFDQNRDRPENWE